MATKKIISPEEKIAELDSRLDNIIPEKVEKLRRRLKNQTKEDIINMIQQIRIEECYGQG